MKQVASILASLVVLGVAALPGSAAADVCPAGSVGPGAAHMVNCNTFYSDGNGGYAGGMANAMSRDTQTPSGNQGMWCAVDITTGAVQAPPSPGSCPEG